jgi:hypothetical protein
MQHVTTLGVRLRQQPDAKIVVEEGSCIAPREFGHTPAKAEGRKPKIDLFF